MVNAGLMSTSTKPDVASSSTNSGRSALSNIDKVNVERQGEIDKLMLQIKDAETVRVDTPVGEAFGLNHCFEANTPKMFV